MGEHVQEQPAIGVQPAAHPRQQSGPIGHVLEHLHRDDAVEILALPGAELVHVGGDHRQVGQSAPGGLALDEGPLRGGIGYRGDARGRVMLGHPQR